MIDLLTAAGGNLASVKKLLERTGTMWREVCLPSDLSSGNPLLIPGVGSFGGVLKKLDEKGFISLLKATAAQGTSILGICSGMQILFESSEESPGVRGLGLIPGKVVRFKEGRVPNIGWSRLHVSGGYVYFVNSYHARTEYAVDWGVHNGRRFTAAAEKGNVSGFQFHPEKSHKEGEEIFRRWRDGL